MLDTFAYTGVYTMPVMDMTDGPADGYVVPPATGPLTTRIAQANIERLDAWQALWDGMVADERAHVELQAFVDSFTCDREHESLMREFGYDDRDIEHPEFD